MSDAFNIRSGSGLRFLALLCLLRWRRPEARLVAALACVPQALYAYDAVPLLLVPQSWVGSAVLVVSSWGMSYFGAASTTFAERAQMATVGTQMVWALYLPATVMILRRPNERPRAS